MTNKHTDQNKTNASSSEQSSPTSSDVAVNSTGTQTPATGQNASTGSNHDQASTTAAATTASVTDKNQTATPSSTTTAKATQAEADKNTADTRQQTPPPQAPRNEDEGRKKAFIKIILLMLLILLLCLIGYGLWKGYQPKELEIQGRVEADTIHISTKVPSRIDEIYVEEGQAVKKGQALVRLHSPEVESKKQQAYAGLQTALALQSTADRGSEQENIDALYANWQSVKAQEQFAAATLRRGSNLYKEGVISRQSRDEMQAAATSSSQMAEAAYQQYARAKRGSTSEQKSSADAQVDMARASVAEVNALEAETQLLAPISGTISKTYGKVSELVSAGVPVVSLIDDQNLWVSLNIREDQYAGVYQAKTLDGYVPALNKNISFSIKNIDAEGEFATIKNTRQTGGYDIRSFKLHLLPVGHVTDLKSGMSVLFKVREDK